MENVSLRYERQQEFIGKLSNTDLTGKVWIGLDIDTSVTTLEGLSFYWDFRAHPERTNTFSCQSPHFGA